MANLFLCMFFYLMFFSCVSLSNATDSIKKFKLEEYIPPDYRYSSSLKIKPQISFSGRKQPESNRYEYSMNPSLNPLQFSKSSSESFYFIIFHRSENFSRKIEYFYSNNFSFNLRNSNRTFYHSRSYDNGNHNTGQYHSSNNKGINYRTDIENNLYYYPIKSVFIGFSISPEIFHAPYDFSKNIRKSISSNESPSDSSGYQFARNKARRNKVRISLTSDISVGFGRIYNVTYGVLALNMLDRINALKRDSQIPVNIQDFSEYIDKLKHRRKYESREALINDIDSIYSYLKFKGMIDDSFPAVRLIMELSDQWQYAGKTIRKSGFRYKLYPELVGYLNWTKGEYTTIEGYDNIPAKNNFTKDYMEDLYEIQSEYSKRDDESGTHKIQGSVCSDFMLKKVLNRYFQLNIYVVGKFGLVKLYSKYYPYVSHSYDRAYPTGNIETDINLGYYPNTRTSINLSMTTRYTKEWDYYLFDKQIFEDPTISTIHDDRNLDIKSSLTLSYFINPRFSYNINGFIDFEDNYSRESGFEKNFNLSLEAGLEYDIF